MTTTSMLTILPETHQQDIHWKDKETFLTYLDKNKQFGENYLQTSIRLQFPEQLQQFNILQTEKDFYYINDHGEITAVYYLQYGFLELFEKYYCETLPGSNKLLIQLHSYINPMTKQTILMYLITSNSSIAWKYGYSKKYFIHNFPLSYMLLQDHSGKTIFDYEQESYQRDKTFSHYYSEIKLIRPFHLFMDNEQEETKYDQDRAFFYQLFESYQFEEAYRFLQSSPVQHISASPTSVNNSSPLTTTVKKKSVLPSPVNACFPPLPIRKSLFFYEEGLLEFFENRLFILKDIITESLFLRIPSSDNLQPSSSSSSNAANMKAESVAGEGTGYVSFAQLNAQTTSTSSSSLSKNMKNRRKSSTVLLHLSALSFAQREIFKQQSFLNRFICFDEEKKAISQSSDDVIVTLNDDNLSQTITFPKYKSFFSFLLKHHLFSLCELLMEEKAIWITENNRENYEACIDYCSTLLSTTKEIEKIHPRSHHGYHDADGRSSQHQRRSSWKDALARGWGGIRSSSSNQASAVTSLHEGEYKNRRHSAPGRYLPQQGRPSSRVGFVVEASNDKEEETETLEADAAVSSKSAPPQPVEHIDYSLYYDMILPPSACRVKNSLIPDKFQLVPEDPMQNIELIAKLKDHLVAKLHGFDLRKLLGTENKSIYR